MVYSKRRRNASDTEPAASIPSRMDRKNRFRLRTNWGMGMDVPGRGPDDLRFGAREAHPGRDRLAAGVPRRDLRDAIGHVMDLFHGERGIQRQRNEPLVKGYSPRALILLQARPGRKERVQRNRNEMDAGSDAARAQFLDEAVAPDLQPVEIQPELIEVPRMASIAALRRRFDFPDCGQAPGIDAGVCGPQGVEPLDLFELMDADGGLHVAEIVFEARLGDLVIPASLFAVAVPGVLADAMQAEHAHAVRQRGIVGGDHAAFAGGDVL